MHMSSKYSFLVFSDNHSRVILSGEEKTDYINASFIDVSARMHRILRFPTLLLHA